MYASRLLKQLTPCIALLPKDPQEDTSGQAWLRSTAARLQADSSMEEDQVQELLNEGLWAVRNTPDLSFPKPERSYIGLIPVQENKEPSDDSVVFNLTTKVIDAAECEIISIDELDEEEEMISSTRAILLAKVI